MAFPTGTTMRTFYRRIAYLEPVDAESGQGRPPGRGEHVTRMAPVKNGPLCAGVPDWKAALWHVKPVASRPHVPWPVGHGWICLRCSHYERGR